MLNRKASGDHYKFTINIKNKPKVVCVCTNHQKFDFNITTMAQPGTKQIAHENQNNRLHKVKMQYRDGISSQHRKTVVVIKYL